MNDEQSFGLQLYNGLRESGHLEVLTAQLNYAGIQELKKADRDGVIKLYRGHPYSFLQRLKNDSPEELVKLIILRAEVAAAAGQQVIPMIILSSL